jgi:hypothetical protein
MTVAEQEGRHKKTAGSISVRPGGVSKIGVAITTKQSFLFPYLFPDYFSMRVIPSMQK